MPSPGLPLPGDAAAASSREELVAYVMRLHAAIEGGAEVENRRHNEPTEAGDLAKGDSEQSGTLLDAASPSLANHALADRVHIAKTA